MSISVFDMFKIGIGPSSSHTVGPMKAAALFVAGLEKAGQLEATARVEVELYGSLAATGRGHGTDKAVLLGLESARPDTIEPETVAERLAAIRADGKLLLGGRKPLRFNEKTDLKFRMRKTLPLHPNGLSFRALDADDNELRAGRYYSVGGGFVVDDSEPENVRIRPAETNVKWPFRSGKQLLEMCSESGLSISGVMLENERFWREPEETIAGLKNIWRVMQDCVRRGCATDGIMPGGLNVRRRAARLHQRLGSEPEAALRDPLTILDWVNLYALAVNEENACGGRVVTAPTNGAAGIIPAVAHYYRRFINGADDDGVCRFLLTAGAIGLLYKENASLSGAEVGCQGEVGVACSMAAGALAEVLGGTPGQVENAAEIGMEHNLGLTCDPVGGLVQIPCIERNAMGSMKAINAARLALSGDGQHHISLDKVIATMRQTGKDMKTKYKETSRGGLAVNVIEC